MGGAKNRARSSGPVPWAIYLTLPGAAPRLPWARTRGCSNLLECSNSDA